MDRVGEIARVALAAGGWAAAALLGAALGALVLHAVLFFVLARVARRTEGLTASSLVRHARRPAQLAMVLLALQGVLPLVPIEARLLAVVHHGLAVALIVAVTWLVIRLVDVVDDVVEARYPLAPGDLQARRVQTQTRVLARILRIGVGVLGAAAVLMTFPQAQELGASLLASAGIIGIAVGLAARPALGNLIAGVQIALTQPIKLEDAVLVEGEFGFVEQITSTFVIVRLWDQRRMVVPLQRFLEQPFQNWTQSSSELLGTVLLWVDPTVRVDAVRAELGRLVEQNELWDGRAWALQVTDANERAVQLRALVSAADAGKLFDLRCQLREALLHYLQREQPGALPRVRAELEGGAARELTDPARQA